MSNFRGLVPILLVTALGIGNGIYVFDPAFKEQNQEKLKEQHPDLKAEAAAPAQDPAPASPAIPASGSSSISKDLNPAREGPPVSNRSLWLTSWRWPWSGQKGEDAQLNNGTPQLPSQENTGPDRTVDNKNP